MVASCVAGGTCRVAGGSSEALYSRSASIEPTAGVSTHHAGAVSRHRVLLSPLQDVDAGKVLAAGGPGRLNLFAIIANTNHATQGPLPLDLLSHNTKHASMQLTGDVAVRLTGPPWSSLALVGSSSDLCTIL